MIKVTVSEDGNIILSFTKDVPVFTNYDTRKSWGFDFAKAAAKTVIDMLAEQDRVAIVEYGGKSPFLKSENFASDFRWFKQTQKHRMQYIQKL